MSVELGFGIKLLDSYNFASRALEPFPKMFSLDELKKGFFPHEFNLPQYQQYVRHIPAVDWYNHNQFSTEKRGFFEIA